MSVCPHEQVKTGQGLVILDVCSGKGIVGAILSRLLPSVIVPP